MKKGYYEIELPKVVAFFDSVKLHADLMKATEVSPNLLVNAEKVTRITTPALQLLISAKKTIEDGGGRFEIKANSSVLDEALNLLGLTEV
jgi:anti-anti-sigma regulatory factor